MIIGCYNDDGTPIEQVDLSERGRVYELEVCIVKHPRRYPEYKVDYSSLAFCSSKESAEQIKDEILQSGENWLNDIYCWYIYERVLDVNYDRSEYMACWLYNESGAMIDKRLFPSYWSEDGFIGRSEDEIRFKFGDLVELYDGHTVRLAYVLASPRKKECYIQKTEENGEPYVGDISDDTYTIIVKVGKGQFIDYMANHEHVDALSLFRPHYLIPQNIQKYWKTFWKLYEKDRRECYGENPIPGQI